MNEHRQEHIDNITQQLNKALDYLAYSFEKIQLLPDNPSQLNQETLETGESFFCAICTCC